MDTNIKKGFSVLDVVMLLLSVKTAEDALWWSYTTITTVGYGDKYPVTTEGRLIAMALMTVGVGLFGAFTAYLTTWFVKDNK